MRRVILPVLILALTLLAPIDAAQAQRRGSGGLISRLFKSGDTTRQAFRTVVADTVLSTVEVLTDGRVTALGAVVEADGYIVTKASELSGEKLEVRLADDEKMYQAELLGLHTGHDLALLKINKTKLTPVAWANADDPTVGQWVATPGLKEYPVAVGVVSTPRRKIAKMPGALGIRRAEDVEGDQTVIGEVYENSAAERAGLKKGDIITHVDGKEMQNFQELAQTVRKHGPGDELTLRVKRGDETFDVVVELSPFSVLPMNENNRGAIQNRMGGKLSTRRYGFPHVYQHDTVLAPAQCGGPLVDLEGRVIGINIARAGRVESYAIPADIVLSILPDLKSGKLAPSNRAGTITRVDDDDDGKPEQVGDGAEKKDVEKKDGEKKDAEVEKNAPKGAGKE